MIPVPNQHLDSPSAKVSYLPNLISRYMSVSKGTCNFTSIIQVAIVIKRAQLKKTELLNVMIMENAHVLQILLVLNVTNV